MIRVHTKSLKENSRRFLNIFLRKQHFSRSFPATAKNKRAQFKIAKMDAIEHGEKRLLTTYQAALRVV